MNKKFIAEAIGTFTLLFFAISTVAFVPGSDVKAALAAPMAFGLAVVAMAYGIGAISGAHLNPAVSLGVWASGRMSTKEMFNYWIAQFVGATVATIVVYFVLGSGMGVTGAGANMPQGEHSIFQALVFEFIATFLFLVVILGVTAKSGVNTLAGVAIGLTLTLIHIAGIPISNVGVNPARTFATNIFAGGGAIVMMWVYFVGPLAGAYLAGMLFKNGMLSADE